MTTRSVIDGRFVSEDDDTWYRIDHFDQMPPFLMALASDSDIWAYVSTSGSLAAGRRDAEGSFFPYETVDRIHLRWEHTGPRTWIRILNADRNRCTELWGNPLRRCSTLQSAFGRYGKTCLRRVFGFARSTRQEA